MTCGIYCLYYECDDSQYYIGKSTNIENRYKKHCSMLKNRTHYNYGLTQGYKEEFPTLSILECCTLDLLNNREVFWIGMYDSFKQGMNETSGGDGSSYGEANSAAYYTTEIYVEILQHIANTDLSYHEIADKLKVEYNVVKLMGIGRTHNYLEQEYPLEYDRLLSKINTRNKGPSSYLYTSNTYKDILDLLVDTNKTFKEISEITNTNLSTIKDISRGASHLHLKKEYPKKYALLEIKRNNRKMLKEEYPTLVSPTGEQYNIYRGEAAEFSRIHKINHGHLVSVLNGKRISTAGWTLA